MTNDRKKKSATPDKDIAFVNALADVLRENGLEELEVRRRGKDSEKLVVRMSRAARPASGLTTAATAPAVSTAPTPPPAEPAPAETPSADPAELPGAVISPMVGTVYLSPEPGVAPFVNVGDRVSEGQTLLIIEAMKTMNQIHATTSGVVKRILVEDASPVEYGAPLMIVG